MKRVKWTRCKYCGAKLKRDHVGQYCPTKNCQWQYGLPQSEDTKKEIMNWQQIEQWLDAKVARLAARRLGNYSACGSEDG